ncbi:MAG: hypothetical protein ACKVTZ_16165 [Bacteroidia bacterium]
MKANFFFLAALLSFSTMFMGCLTETPKGQKKLESTSRQWIAYNGGEKISFSNGDATISFTATTRKSIFNDVTDCYNVNAIKEVCDIYGMEYDYMMFQTMGGQFRINYAIEKKLDNKNFNDQLQVAVQEVDFPELKGTKTVNGTTANAQEMELLASVKLNGKTFQNVYRQGNATTGQELYFAKGTGVVAFKSNNELWVKL